MYRGTYVTFSRKISIFSYLLRGKKFRGMFLGKKLCEKSAECLLTPVGLWYKFEIIFAKKWRKKTCAYTFWRKIQPRLYIHMQKRMIEYWFSCKNWRKSPKIIAIIKWPQMAHCCCTWVSWPQRRRSRSRRTTPRPCRSASRSGCTGIGRTCGRFYESVSAAIYGQNLLWSNVGL
jgi:hypothetical protein